MLREHARSGIEDFARSPMLAGTLAPRRRFVCWLRVGPVWH
jgi:hypothetical protein